MKTSYRKIYLFLLLLTSYSCNDLTETKINYKIIDLKIQCVIILIHYLFEGVCNIYYNRELVVGGN